MQRRRKWIRAAAMFGVVAGQVPGANADIVLGAPKPPASREPHQAPTVDPSDDSSSMRQGLVTAISERGDRVEIQGHWHSIDATSTRFIRSGQLVSADVLKKGQALKFTLKSGKGAATLGVVYVP